MLREGNEVALRAVIAPPDAADDESTSIGMRFPIERAILWDEIKAGRAVIIDDVRGDSRYARAYRGAVGARIDTTFQAVRSWLGVPMSHGDDVIGMLLLSRATPNFYSERHAQLVTAIASQAAIAVENARLFEQAEDRTRELSALLRVSQSIASTIALNPLLAVLVEQLRTVVDCYGVTV